MYYSKENRVGADHCYRFCWLRLPSLSAQFHRNTRAIVAAFLFRKLFAILKKREKSTQNERKKRMFVTILRNFQSQSTQAQRTGHISKDLLSYSQRPTNRLQCIWIKSVEKERTHTLEWCSHLKMCDEMRLSCCFTPSRLFFCIPRPKTLFAQWTYLHIIE